MIIKASRQTSAPDYVATLPGTTKRIGGRVYSFQDYPGCDRRKYMRQIQDGVVVHVHLLDSRTGRVIDFVANHIGRFIADGFVPADSYYPEFAGQVLPVEDCDQPEANQ